MEYICWYDSPLGRMKLSANDQGLTGAWFEGQRYEDADLSEDCCEKETDVLKKAKGWLDRYYDGRDPGELPPLSAKGSYFREMVWEILKTIPYGETMSYGEIARQIAKMQGKKTMSAQAVGGAVGHNPVSIFIPCHRVLGSDGSLTGYAGGIEKKKALLLLEGHEEFR